MDQQREVISKLLEAIKHVRKAVHPDIAISHLATFLITALKDEVTMQSVAEALETTQPSISRGVKQMSRYKRSGVLQGYDILYTTPDLEERRQYVIKLTKKGDKLKQELIKIMMTDEED